MKNSCNQAVVLDSWRRCAKVGLSPDNPEESCYPLSTKNLQLLYQNHQMEITAFRQIMSNSQMPKGSVSILTDAQGILLEKKLIGQKLEIFSTGFFLFRGPCGCKCPFPGPHAARTRVDAAGAELLYASLTVCPICPSAFGASDCSHCHYDHGKTASRLAVCLASANEAQHNAEKAAGIFSTNTYLHRSDPPSKECSSLHGTGYDRSGCGSGASYQLRHHTVSQEEAVSANGNR